MKRVNILIVDDDETNIKLLKGMLISENYHLYGASNGKEALKMVGEISPDLILLDVMMPGIDGFEVCRRLKEDEKTRMIPVVMVTVLAEKEYQIRAMEAGADDFLSKPVDQTELRVRVKSLLRIKSYHDDLVESHRELTEKNEKLQELERIKEGLIHMIIHDLNNPLMAISGNLELFLEEKQDFSESQFQKIEKCLQYCRDLKNLIQSLLDIHILEEGHLELNKEVTDMTELTDSVLELFVQKTEAKQISLSFPRPGDIPSVKVDRQLTKRVGANLLNNAIRHTPKGGKVEVIINHLPDNKNICFSVRDNGIGLAPEYHRKVFDKFEQVELKKEGVMVGDSGLGLAFCKTAVEAHGGKIWVESEGEGKGCTFSFVIPV
ncbi:MAG: response regulator [Deltaproteobacteria bacterium]|nr:response regulator [Deltaproteobacteria bacterium]